MSWQDLEPIVKLAVANCKASIRVVKGGPKITLSFSEPFFREIGAPKKASVLAHPTEAKMLLKPAKDGKFTVSEIGQGGGRINNVPVPKWAPEGDHEGERCTTEKTADGWVIGLPVSAWHAKTTYAAKAAEQAKTLPTVSPKPLNAPIPRGGKIDAVEYLRKKGWKCSKLSPSTWTLDGESATLNQILKQVNSERAEANLPPLTVDDIA